jgi:hypothetical protein
MSAGKHAVAESVVQRRKFGLAPDPGESVPAFASRVLDAVSEQLIDLVNGTINDRAEDLSYGMNPHRVAEALRVAVAHLVNLMNDTTALLDVIPDDEAILP